MVEDQNIVRGRNGPYHCLVHMWELNDVDVRNGPCHICVSLCVYASGVCVCCVWIHIHAHMYPYICMPTVYSVYGCVLGVILLFLQGLVVRCFLTDQCGLLCGYMKVSFPLTHPPTFNFVVF